MKKIIKYTGQAVYMFPNGALATPEAVLEQFPAILTFPHIIETDEAEQVFFAVDNLSAARSRHGINPALTETEAIDEIERIVNLPPPDPGVSVEERTAAALEFLGLMMM